jgi:hypothetical protein
MRIVILVLTAAMFLGVNVLCAQQLRLDGKREACRQIFRELYKDLDIKAVDEDSLKNYCKNKFDK